MMEVSPIRCDRCGAHKPLSFVTIDAQGIRGGIFESLFCKRCVEEMEQAS